MPEQRERNKGASWPKDMGPIYQRSECQRERSGTLWLEVRTIHVEVQDPSMGVRTVHT